MHISKLGNLKEGVWTFSPELRKIEKTVGIQNSVDRNRLTTSMEIRRFVETPWVLYRGEKKEDYVALKGAIWYSKATSKSIKDVTENVDLAGTEQGRRLIQRLRRQERTLLITVNEILKHQDSKGTPAMAPVYYKEQRKVYLALKKWPLPAIRYQKDRAVQIISNSIKIEEVFTREGETVITNIPAREGDQDHLINVFTSNLLLKALRADSEGYKELARANIEWYARYYIWVRPLVLETMALQYARGGFKAYQLYSIVCTILGFETGLQNCHLLQWNEVVDRARESWLTEWLTIFHKIEHLFHGNVDAETTCLSFIFKDLITPTEMALITHHKSRQLELRVRIVHNFHAIERCRRCYGKAQEKETCKECDMKYCSGTCRIDDYLDHLRRVRNSHRRRIIE